MGAFPKPEDISRPTPVEDTLRRVIDTIPCLVTRSQPDGYVDFANRRWLEFTGLRLEEVLGWGWRAAIHPEDVEKHVRKTRLALATGVPLEDEARLRRSDGEYRWFLIRKVPLRDEHGETLKWYGTCHDIEDLKQATEKLRQSEAELLQILDAIPAHVFVLEPDPNFLGGRILPNRQDLEYTGRTLQEVREHHVPVLHPDDRERLRRLRQRALDEGIPFQAEARVRGKDGQYRWFLIRVNPLRDEGGRIIRWYGTRTDIEDQKRAEEHLRLVIDTIPQQIWSCTSDGSLDFLNAQWRSYTGLTQEEAQGDGWQRLLQRVLHPDDRDRVRKAWLESVTNGTPFEQEARRRAANGQYRWFLARGVPLKDSDGRIVRWYGTSTDIEDRKKAEDHLRLVIDTIPQQIMSGPGDGTLDFANAQWRSYTGLTPEELQGRGWQRIIHPDDLEPLLKAVEESRAQGKPYEQEVRRRGADGRYRWFLARGVPLKDSDGRIVRWYGSNTDIEDRKRAEQELKVSEERHRVIVETASDAVISMDEDGGILLANPATARIFGYDPIELIGKPLTILMPEFMGKLHEAGFRRYLATGHRHLNWQGADFTGLRKNGQEFPVEVSFGEMSSNGHKVFTGFIRDVSEKKRAEDELRKQKEVFQKIFENIPVLIAFRGEVDHLALVNPEWERTMGWTLKEIREQDPDVLVHAFPDPQYRQMVKDEIAASTGEWTDLKVRVRDGRFIDVIAAFVRLSDDSTVFIARDITERKRAEAELRESEARFRLVADSAPVMIWMSGTDKLCTYFNKRWLDFTGRSLDQELGNGWAEGVDPEDFQRCLDTYIQAFDRREAFRMEYRLRRQDGEYRWVLDTGVPRFTSNGSFAGYIGSSIDVQEQHEARTGLQKAFSEIKTLRDQLYQENLVLKEQISDTSMFEEIIGSSAALRRILVLVEKVAPTDSTVLITGETGTGKELVARAIHKRSKRAKGSFVSVNCSAIPPSLVASELFGSEKGAFTGATERRLGRFELADEGTIFLDEIGDLPPETQIALLRVLQERTFERVGGSQPIAVNVRVLAATNRDLHAAVEAGKFRQDLFYRLNVFPIHAPPLRDRITDIPLLVEYFAERYAKKAGKRIKHIKKKTLELLQAYDWPGNIRELQNVIERAVILCDGDTLAVDETWLQHESLTWSVVRGLGRLDEDQERELIESALTETRGQIAGPSGAAARLGIPRSTLESKVRTLGIDKQRFKAG